jgi:hypothetical protein
MSEIISVTDKDIFYLFKLLYLLADDNNIQNHLTTAATTCDIPEECFEEITQHFQGMAKMQKARDILLEEIAIKNLLEENSIDYEKFSIAYANALRQL